MPSDWEFSILITLGWEGKQVGIHENHHHWSSLVEIHDTTHLVSFEPGYKCRSLG